MKLMRITFIIVMLTGSVALGASPRKSIAIIECTPNKKFESALDNISSSFSENGYDDISKYMNSLKNGWKGTGFVVKDSYGQYYLFSNKHVLGDSEKISISFNESRRKFSFFHKDAIIFEDRHLDIAMIVLPRNMGKFNALPLYTRNVDDGSEIFAAGYPDLLGRPTWQLSKGVVTNFSTAVPSIVDPGRCKLIQHSAAIDPGSSGGPLLRKNRGTGRWSVVGVSAFTIIGRQDTHFAIPAKKVRDLINLYKSKKRSRKNRNEVRKELSLFMKDFNEQLKSNSWNSSKAHRFVSISMTAEKGWNSIIQLFNESKEEFLAEMKVRFESLSFFDAMRECVSWSIWYNFRSHLDGENKTSKFKKWKTLPVTSSEGTTATAIIEVDKTPHEVQLVYERGHWYVNSFEFEIEKEPKIVKENEEQEFESGSYSFYMGVGMVPQYFNNEYDGNESVTGLGIFIGGEFGLFKYISYSHTLYGGYLKHIVEDRNDFESIDPMRSVNSFEVDYQFALRLRMPLSFRWGYFTPYILGGVEMFLAFNDETMFNVAMPLDAGGGIEIIFKGGHGFGFNAFRRFDVIGIADKIEDLKLNMYYVIHNF